MPIIETIKKLIHFKPRTRYPINYTRVFRTFDEFMKHVAETDSFDRHFVYYYDGSSKSLTETIHNNPHGERDIPDSRLQYVGECNDFGNNILFSDILFFPDQVFDIKAKYTLLDSTREINCFYRSDDFKMHTVESVVIARDNVYLCNKA